MAINILRSSYSNWSLKLKSRANAAVIMTTEMLDNDLMMVAHNYN